MNEPNENGNEGGNDPRLTVSRILLISPEQNELTRRNHSRIFVSQQSESMIDSILFQTVRPIDLYGEAAGRAITMAGLTDSSGGDQIRAVDSPNFAGGMLRSHFATLGWLQDENKTVYDLAIEFAIEGEALPDLELTRRTAVLPEANEFNENPVVIAVGIENLVPAQLSDNVVHLQPVGEGQGTGEPEPAADRERMAARQAQEGEGGNQGGSAGGAMERQAGRPGRVRDPALDMRLRANRAQRRPQEGEGQGRESGGGQK